MVPRHVVAFARLGVLLPAALGVTALACSKEPAAPRVSSPTVTSAKVETFHFAPPDGTTFYRQDRRTLEQAIVGAPLRSTEEEQLRWKVAIRRDGDRYRVKQDLVGLTLKQDGAVVAEGDVREGISAELVLDRDGRLLDIKGLEKTAARLRELAAPGKEAAFDALITPQYLGDVVANRYRVLFAETIGRQATPGSSWTLTNPAGSVVTSRKMTVERMEPCGTTTCARMRVDFDVDPKLVADAATDLVKRSVAESGGDASKIAVRSSTYGMRGTMLVEPRTMLSHGAALAETGRVTVAAPSGAEITVEVKGTTEIGYQYEPMPMAARPSPADDIRAAME